MIFFLFLYKSTSTKLMVLKMLFISIVVFWSMLRSLTISSLCLSITWTKQQLPTNIFEDLRTTLEISSPNQLFSLNPSVNYFSILKCSHCNSSVYQNWNIFPIKWMVWKSLLFTRRFVLNDNKICLLYLGIVAASNRLKFILYWMSVFLTKI